MGRDSDVREWVVIDNLMIGDQGVVVETDEEEGKGETGGEGRGDGDGREMDRSRERVAASY